MNIEDIENIDIDFDIDEVIEEMLNVGVDDNIQEIILEIVEYALTHYDYDEAKIKYLDMLDDSKRERVRKRLYSSYISVEEYPIVQEMLKSCYTTLSVLKAMPSTGAVLTYLHKLIPVYLARRDREEYIKHLESKVVELKQTISDNNAVSFGSKREKRECAKRLREDNKWTQIEISEHLQVSLTTIKRWEKAWKTANTSK